jgi:hypothetical protein
MAWPAQSSQIPHVIRGTMIRERVEWPNVVNFKRAFVRIAVALIRQAAIRASHPVS